MFVFVLGTISGISKEPFFRYCEGGCWKDDGDGKPNFTEIRIREAQQLKLPGRDEGSHFDFVRMYVEQDQVEVNEACPVMIVARDPPRFGGVQEVGHSRTKERERTGARRLKWMGDDDIRFMRMCCPSPGIRARPD